MRLLRSWRKSWPRSHTVQTRRSLRYSTNFTHSDAAPEGRPAEASGRGHAPRARRGRPGRLLPGRADSPPHQRHVQAALVIRMTLCHSRHGYEDAVWTLDLPSFLRLHEPAFRNFGGVVQVVRSSSFMDSGVACAKICSHVKAMSSLDPVFRRIRSSRGRPIGSSDRCSAALATATARLHSMNWPGRCSIARRSMAAKLRLLANAGVPVAGHRAHQTAQLSLHVLSSRTSVE